MMMSDENNVTPWKDRLFAETPEARRLPEGAVDEMGLYHAHAEIGELRAATAAQASTIVALKEREMGLEAALGIASKAAAAPSEEAVEGFVLDDGEEYKHPRYGRGVFFTYNSAKLLYTDPVEIQEVRKHAERYEFLRERTVKWNSLNPTMWTTGGKLDAAIDAAILANQSQKG